MSNLEFYKTQFFQSHLVHLNNAGLCPISLPAKNEIDYWSKRFYEEGFYTDADYIKRMAWSREQLANLVGCQSDEIAFFQATSGAISQFAFHIGLKDGDEVLTWDQEYSSNLYPWQEACLRAKARLVMAPSNPDLSLSMKTLTDLISAKTKVISVSWVQFQTGHISDLAMLSDICKAKSIHLFVDVIQGLGIIPFDMSKLHISAVAGGSHKWLSAPVGTGFLAINKSLALQMKPLMVGSATYGTCDDPSNLECVPKRDATKFESGSKQAIEIMALGASVELILKSNPQTLYNEILRLKTKLHEGLLSLGFQVHSPLQKNGLSETSVQAPLYSPSKVNFTSKKKSPQELKNILAEKNVNCALRGPGVRFSPAAFNTDQNIERALEVLKPYA